MNLAEKLYEEIRNHNKQIIVIGDNITDVWVHGRLTDCQDGCPKFIEQDRHQTLGGASNAAHCLTYWAPGYILYGHPKNFQPVKTRFINAHGSIVFRHDDETHLLPIIDYDYIRRDALHHIKHSDCAGVLLSDYDKRILTSSFIRDVTTECNQRGIPCISDAKRRPEFYRGSIIKSNLDWHNKHLHCAHVYTRGPDNPMTKYGVVSPKLPAVECLNHVGAGDCFAAILTLALAYKFTLEEAAIVAHSAGRVYVQYPHNRPPRPEEVIEDMKLAVAPPSFATTGVDASDAAGGAPSTNPGYRP